MNGESAEDLLVPAPRQAAELSDPFDRDVAALAHPAGGDSGGEDSDGEDDRLALLGVPFDTTTMGRRGSKRGPAAIRQALSGLLAYHGGFGADLSRSGGVSDFGDVAVVDTDVEETCVGSAWSRRACAPANPGADRRRRPRADVPGPVRSRRRAVGIDRAHLLLTALGGLQAPVSAPSR